MAKSKWDNVKDKLLLVEKWARDGLTEEQIAKNLGISKSTMNDYKNKRSDFLNALKKGKEVIIAEIENALIKRALGYDYEEVKTYIRQDDGITAHHIIELTPENVSDHMISLNPDNILLVHSDCHNKIHQRFGYQAMRRVFVVWGAPLSGKSTFVSANVKRGDIVVDMDRLFEAITMQPAYDKPDSLLPNIKGVYNLLLDNIKTRYGKWGNAYVIGGLADKYKRERLLAELGAEGIHCRASKEECLARLEQDVDRRPYKGEWSRYIEEWFARFTA